MRSDSMRAVYPGKACAGTLRAVEPLAGIKNPHMDDLGHVLAAKNRDWSIGENVLDPKSDS